MLRRRKGIEGAERRALRSDRRRFGREAGGEDGGGGESMVKLLGSLS